MALKQHEHKHLYQYKKMMIVYKYCWTVLVVNTECDTRLRETAKADVNSVLECTNAMGPRWSRWDF